MLHFTRRSPVDFLITTLVLFERIYLYFTHTLNAYGLVATYIYYHLTFLTILPVQYCTPSHMEHAHTIHKRTPIIHRLKRTTIHPPALQTARSVTCIFLARAVPTLIFLLFAFCFFRVAFLAPWCDFCRLSVFSMTKAPGQPFTTTRDHYFYRCIDTSKELSISIRFTFLSAFKCKVSVPFTL